MSITYSGTTVVVEYETLEDAPEELVAFMLRYYMCKGKQS